jgi:hypothetical protein
MPERPKTEIEPIDPSRLREDVRIKIDAWIAAQPEPRPSRSQAIQHLLAEALAKEADARAILAEDLKTSNEDCVAERAKCRSTCLRGSGGQCLGRGIATTIEPLSSFRLYPTNIAMRASTGLRDDRDCNRRDSRNADVFLHHSYKVAGPHGKQPALRHN